MGDLHFLTIRIKCTSQNPCRLMVWTLYLSKAVKASKQTSQPPWENADPASSFRKALLCSSFSWLCLPSLSHLLLSIMQRVCKAADHLLKSFTCFWILLWCRLALPYSCSQFGPMGHSEQGSGGGGRHLSKSGLKQISYNTNQTSLPFSHNYWWFSFLSTVLDDSVSSWEQCGWADGKGGSGDLEPCLGSAGLPHWSKLLTL